MNKKLYKNCQKYLDNANGENDKLAMDLIKDLMNVIDGLENKVEKLNTKIKNLEEEISHLSYFLARCEEEE